MKFTIDDSFSNIDRAGFEKLFLDEEFNRAMMSVSELKTRELLDRREEGGKLHRRIKVVPQRDLPGFMKKLIQGELTYIEESVFDPARHVLDWTSQVSVMSDKIKLFGKVEFLEAPNGARRRLTGEMNVSVFGVGGMIEKAVVANLEETYRKITVFTQSWIDGKRS